MGNNLMLISTHLLFSIIIITEQGTLIVLKGMATHEDIKIPVIITPREEWGAEPPRSVEETTLPVPKVVYSYDLKIDICKTREECLKAVKELQRRHMEEEGCDDIKYNFLIGGDCNIYEGRGWNAKPCVSLKYKPYHNKRIDIAFIGNYWGNPVVPPTLVVRSFELIRHGVALKYIAKERRLYEIVGSPYYGYVLRE